MKVEAAPRNPPEDLTEPALALPAPRPIRPVLYRACPYIVCSPPSPEPLAPTPALKLSPAPARLRPPSAAPAAAVPWRKPPLPVYRQPRCVSPAQTLLELRLKRRLDNLPDPQNLSAECWQQLDSINRKDAARLIDKLSGGTMILQLKNVRALFAQGWSRSHLQQFLCWLLYLDRGPDNLVVYTEEARLCLKHLLDEADLDEAQIYIDLSRIQQRGFHLKAHVVFCGWDDGAVWFDAAAVAALRAQVFVSRPQLRHFFMWLIGCDATGAPFHNVQIALTQDGAKALMGFFREQGDPQLWALARRRLPRLAQDPASWRH